MNWYKIPLCPNYAISEDGEVVKNIKTNKILKHNTTPYAKDGLRRVTLRHKVTYYGKTRSVTWVFTLESLKIYIVKENLIKN